jgi:hypothetical protein
MMTPSPLSLSAANLAAMEAAPDGDDKESDSLYEEDEDDNDDE